MHRAHHKWHSRSLNRDMELLQFGHAGPPMIVFPSSMGTFFEYENMGMVDAVAGKLEHGALQLFCVSSVDTESWYDRHVHPRDRVIRHPSTFTWCVSMGGAFDISQFLDGYYDDDAYFLNPLHFLANLGDSGYLD